MCTVRIGIGHDDHFIVIGIFDFEICPDTRTDCVDDGIDLFIFKNIFKLSLFRIDDFTSEREDCLELTVSALFGRAAGRIALNKEEFILFGVFTLSWCKLA